MPPSPTEYPAGMIRSFSWMLLADAVCSELDDQESESYNPNLARQVMRPQEDIVETAKGWIEHYCADLPNWDTRLEEALAEVDKLSERIVQETDKAWAGKLTIAELYVTGYERDAHRQVLNALGHGVSAWDDLRPEDWGLDGDETQPLLFEGPYDAAYLTCALMQEAWSYRHRDKLPAS